MKKSNYIYPIIGGLAVAVLLNTVLVARRHYSAIPKVTPTPTVVEGAGMMGLSRRAAWLNTNQRLTPEAKSAIEKLITDAEKDGMCLVVSSGFRTLEQQVKVKAEYGDLAEDPGKSEHHTGLAVDLQACPMTDGKRDDEAERLTLIKPFDELPEYKWLKKNAAKYGFTQSYEVEPWHWKLTGVLQSVAKDDYSLVSFYDQTYCDKHSPACITASGEKFDDTKLTVACAREYKIGDTLKITYNGKSVTARCNDRGGFEKYGRKLDLSRATFLALAPLSRGVIKVKIEKI